jgi:uncharacterized membrane protein YbhN (UPF0104 family)
VNFRAIILKSLAFVLLAAAIVAAMIRFGLIDVTSLILAFDHGKPWLALAFSFGLLSALINLWRYMRILRLMAVDIPFRGAAAATSVSLFVGQWLPGSMAVSEMVRLGLMMGAGKIHSNTGSTAPSPEKPLVTSIKARIFVASFLDRACGLILFLTVGTVACALSLVTASQASSLAAHEFTILGLLMCFGVVGAVTLLTLPWLAKHPAVLRTLETQAARWHQHAGKLGPPLAKIILTVRKITGPMADESFTYGGFYRALAISSMSSLLLVGAFYTCSMAVGFNMSYVQIAAVFPFLAIAQLLPIGFAGIGGHQLVAVALFQAFSLEASGVATVSLVQGLVSLILNTVVGVFFFQTSAHQVKAILQRPDATAAALD